jgi:hypothetical protein
MLEHEGVILEDPPEPDFLAMLAGEEDEIKAWRLSGLLSFEDCANLYPEVSQALPQEAGDLVQAYLARKAR